MGPWKLSDGGVVKSMFHWRQFLLVHLNLQGIHCALRRSFQTRRLMLACPMHRIFQRFTLWRYICHILIRLQLVRRWVVTGSSPGRSWFHCTWRANWHCGWFLFQGFCFPLTLIIILMLRTHLSPSLPSGAGRRTEGLYITPSMSLKLTTPVIFALCLS
jgi:hypothetical protein